MVREWALRFSDEVGEQAKHWAEIYAIPTSFITETVRRAQSDGHCADDACIATQANIFYRHLLQGRPLR